MEETYSFLNPWWEGGRPDAGVLREEYLSALAPSLSRRTINVLIGSRRIGKTTLVKQIIERLLDKGTEPQDLLYLQLDHPRLSGATVSDHLKRFRRLFSHKRTRKQYLFLDEVQESPNWEAELKSLHDTENVKIVCTGSTASLLASQGGKLTGRQTVTTVYPLSFREFLAFRGEKTNLSESYRLEKLAEEYLQVGGYPENVLDPSEEYLHNLLQDIVARDLLRLHDLRRSNLLMDLLRLIAAGVGSRTSFNKLAKTLGITVDTVKDYVGHFEAAFLVRTLEKWTPSHTERTYAPRKVYLVDTGLKTLLTGKGDLGAKAETAVFMRLLRTKQHPGYFAESEREVDFVLGNPTSPEPIEVKYADSLDAADRRLGGLRLFLRRYPNTQVARVISHTQGGDSILNSAQIQVTPLWKFLLAE
ncbi:MAG: ATP-binding protein [Armatimonadetes bacterium]|nr:ATP-binding protein [Armatimonadota bacterium]